MDLLQPQILIEIILSVLLCAGILYSFYITRVLSSLKRDKETLENLLKSLQESINTAETGMEQLRITSEISGRPLNRLIEKAKEIQEGLNARIISATRVQDKIQKSLDKTPEQINSMNAVIKEVQNLKQDMSSTLKDQERDLQKKQRQERQKNESYQSQQRMLARKEEALRIQRGERPDSTPEKKEQPQSLFTDSVSVPSTARLSQERPYLRALQKK